MTAVFLFLLTVASLFYLITGVMAARVMMGYQLIEAALGSLSDTEEPFWVRHQVNYLIGGLFIIMASAILCLFQVNLALALCAFGMAHQAVYFFYLAPKKIDPFEAPDPKGRKQSQNAFLGYGFYSLAVGWAHLGGHLRPLTALATWELTALGLMLTALIGYGLYLFRPFRP